MRAVILLGCAALAGCGASFGLQATFSDELVEAPARSARITVHDRASCEELFTKSSTDAARLPDVLASFERGYPIDPTDDSVFESLPTDQALTFDVVVLDERGLMIARGCESATLGTLEAALPIPVHTLPVCASAATSLDVMLVLDTSVGMQLADQDGAHIPELLATVFDPEAVFPDTVWGIVTYGHESRASERLPPTTDFMAARNLLHGLETVAQGESRLFDGITLGAELLRARAVCGRKPVLFAVVGFADRGSEHTFEDAQIGIVSSRGEPADDLYFVGVALTTEGYGDLDDLLPTTVLGSVTGAANRALMTQAFRDVRDTLAELRTPPASP